MSKRTLPKADMSTRPGLRTEVQSNVLDRWNPDVQAAEEGAENTISVLDVIGETWDGTGVTARRIAAALRAIGERPVVVNVNSPGGDFFEGLAIYNALREHKAEVTVNILGLAASAASIIAMAGDTVRIARAGFLMIHNTQVTARGDRNDLRDVADWLAPFDEVVAEIYAARSGLKADAVSDLLDKETWIGGADAVAKGLADELLPSDQVKNLVGADGGTKPVVAEHKIDALLAELGVTRSERRGLIKALKTGMPGAAEGGTRTAAMVTEVEQLLASMKSI